MRRDFDLIRQLLLHVEAEGQARVWRQPLTLPTDDLDAASEAIDLMLEKGLLTSSEPLPNLEAHPVTYHRGLALTWDGHDFLDSIRDDEIWRRTKEGVAAARGWSFDLIRALAKGLIKTKIEQHTGIELDLG